jgi:hypothetical protein
VRVWLNAFRPKSATILILRSDRSFTIHVIGAVSKDGQQDFENQQMPLKYETDRAAAVACRCP